MGRTNATYRNHLDNFMEKFRPFRRALRSQNKDFFDMLWEKAHSHAQAGAYMNSFRPEIPAMVSMMLGLQSETSENRDRIQELEQKIEELESEIDRIEV